MRHSHAALSLLLASVVSVLLGVGRASAEQITTTLKSADGTSPAIKILLSDEAGDGTLLGRVNVTDGSLVDLKKIQLNLGDKTLLPGLTVTGDVTSFDTSARSADLAGTRAQQRRAERARPVDLGIRLDSAASAADGTSPGYIEFVISHETEFLTLALFSQQLVGVRVAAEDVQKPAPGSGDGGSSAPAGPAASSMVVTTIPEPGTATLLYLGLLSLGPAARALRSSR